MRQSVTLLEDWLRVFRPLLQTQILHAPVFPSSSSRCGCELRCLTAVRAANFESVQLWLEGDGPGGVGGRGGLTTRSSLRSTRILPRRRNNSRELRDCEEENNQYLMIHRRLRSLRRGGAGILSEGSVGRICVLTRQSSIHGSFFC